MARKREVRQSRHMKPVFLVVCEGETEEAYVDFLRQSYRSPIKIIAKVSGNEITKRKLDAYRQDLKIKISESIKTFLVYDMDVEAVVSKLNELDAELLLSNPCFELWFLLHNTDIHTDITSSKCVRMLMESEDVWANYKKSFLSMKQKEILWNNRKIAIQRAKKLLKFKNPSSNMYKLLEILDNIRV